MAVSVGELAERAVEGDRIALGRLLVLYDPRLRRRIGRKIGADAGARGLSVEDVLQETYTAGYRHIQRFESRGPEAFYKWLAAIGDHKFLDAVKALRAAKRRPRSGARRIAVDRSTSFLGLAQLLDGRRKTPSGVIARREAVQALQVALASLPSPCRQAVWMRHIDGKSPREIAATLGRTERAVHQLCYRGLAQLRERLGSRSKFLSGSR